MKIGFIGAGRVGFSLGKYFINNGLNVIGYYSKNKDDSLLAGKFTNSECYENLNDIVNDCDTLFLTINDDAISEIVNELLKLNIKNKYLIHTSGAKSSLIFGELNRNNYCYSLHPIFAFNDKYESYKSLNKAAFSLEGNSNHINDILCLIESLGNKIIVIDSNNKTAYHAACVMMSNLVDGLIDLSFSELRKIGIEDSSIFMPLILNNISNIESFGTLKSLTGPIRRNDIGTVKEHLKCISDDAKRVYIPLSIKVAEMTKKLGINNEEMINLLKGVDTSEKDN